MTNYIDYRTLNDFYTIEEACNLLDVKKQDLKTKCEQLGIRPIRNAAGAGCFTKHDVRKIHNTMYLEDHERWDPWA